MNFLRKLELEYPIPKAASIWGNPSLTDLSDFVELCLSELQSDLEVYETMQVSGLQTHMPEGTRAISSVKLNVPFQGNRYVKWSFDVHSGILNVRYYPAVVSYKRAVTMDDLNPPTPPDPLRPRLKALDGARLQYVKAYILEKMLAKEIAYLSAIVLDTDAGALNIDALEKMRLKFETQVTTMKDDIMLYSNG